MTAATLTPPSIGVFLRRLFSQLEQAGVRYCVLRNYEGLPEKVEHDVDVLVGRSQVALFERCLTMVARGWGWQLLRRTVRYEYRSFDYGLADGEIGRAHV
jgi:hypothetical protein